MHVTDRHTHTHVIIVAQLSLSVSGGGLTRGIGAEERLCGDKDEEREINQTGDIST